LTLSLISEESYDWERGIDLIDYLLEVLSDVYILKEIDLARFVVAVGCHTAGSPVFLQWLQIPSNLNLDLIAVAAAVGCDVAVGFVALVGSGIP